ncbi:MAG: DUF4345 domain-containing protein [Candidatus Rokuibacteriota bacterium]
MKSRERTISIVLGLAGTTFALVGLSHLTVPERMLAPLGIALTSPTALSEVRSGYGGLHLALGIVFLGGIVSPRLRDLAMLMLTAVIGGLALGRLLSLVIDGAPELMGWALLILESFGAVALAALALPRWTARAQVRRR